MVTLTFFDLANKSVVYLFTSTIRKNAPTLGAMTPLVFHMRFAL